LNAQWRDGSESTGPSSCGGTASGPRPRAGSSTPPTRATAGRWPRTCGTGTPSRPGRMCHGRRTSHTPRPGTCGCTWPRSGTCQRADCWLRDGRDHGRPTGGRYPGDDRCGDWCGPRKIATIPASAILFAGMPNVFAPLCPWTRAPGKLWHSADDRAIHWYGSDYSFSVKQTIVVAAL
jgi:hypothetical protein